MTSFHHKFTIHQTAFTSLDSSDKIPQGDFHKRICNSLYSTRRFLILQLFHRTTKLPHEILVITKWLSLAYIFTNTNKQPEITMWEAGSNKVNTAISWWHWSLFMIWITELHIHYKEIRTKDFLELIGNNAKGDFRDCTWIWSSYPLFKEPLNRSI